MGVLHGGNRAALHPRVLADGFAGESHRRRLRHGAQRRNRVGRTCNRCRRGKHLAALLLHLLYLALDRGDDVVVVFQVFKEVGDVQEGVAIEADIDEGRLHAGQHAGDAAPVDATD